MVEITYQNFKTKIQTLFEKAEHICSLSVISPCDSNTSLSSHTITIFYSQGGLYPLCLYLLSMKLSDTSMRQQLMFNYIFFVNTVPVPVCLSTIPIRRSYVCIGGIFFRRKKGVLFLTMPPISRSPKNEQKNKGLCPYNFYKICCFRLYNIISHPSYRWA